MPATPYTTLQDIIEEAGLAHSVRREVPEGVADGANKVFTTQNKPLIDSNYDDAVTADDLRVYVNGSPVEVVEIDDLFGNITLQNAPAEDAEVYIDYRYSAVNMRYVSEVRSQAEAFINNRMKTVSKCVPYGRDGKEVPVMIKGLTRQLAAAWILIREYGYNQDVEDTSKDGYKRRETVLADLESYALTGGECDDDDGGDNDLNGMGSFATASDGDLFPQPDFDREKRHSDDWEY